MAFGAKQISPIDLNKNAAVGVNMPFSGPGALQDMSTSGSVTLPLNPSVIQTPFVLNYTTKDSIKNNLINFFLTNPGERPLNPSFGGGLRDFIFEQITSNNLDGLEDIISFKLNRFFPNVSIDNLEILQQTDNNNITVDLKYSIKNTNIYDTVELNFE
jgi:phage baseplate assembly protein W